MLIRRNGDFVELVVNGVIRAALQRDCTMNISTQRQSVEIVDSEGLSYTIFVAAVLETQVLPAAAVPFSGDLVALWTLLVQQFFNELHTSISGGGGVVEDNIIYQSGNYSIVTTNYIIVAIGNGNFRLPTIGSDLGQIYRIFANNNTVNVLCDTPSGDSIIGQISVTLKKYDSATFRALASNLWLIGD